MIVLLILSGVQIMSVGIIGEYIARIFEEAKGRPLYLFKQRPPDDPHEVPDGLDARPGPR